MLHRKCNGQSCGFVKDGISWFAVLCIRDILVQIRIHGSVSLTYGFGSCLFRHWLTRCQQKIFFSANYFLKVHLHQFFIDKKSKWSNTIVEIKVFLDVLLVDERIRIRTTIMTEPDPHSDPEPPIQTTAGLASSNVPAWLCHAALPRNP